MAITEGRSIRKRREDTAQWDPVILDLVDFYSEMMGAVQGH